MNINATLIGQVIWFGLFVLFCMKFVWPPLVNALDERKKKIADGLNAADQAGRDLADAQSQVEANLKEAKNTAAEIIEQANKRATQLIEEAKTQARDEGDRLKLAAQAEIDQEANRAREQLRKDVATLALVGAEKILVASVDQSAHSQMLDQLAADL